MNKIHEPRTFAEAANDPRWVEAINQKFEAIYSNKTWEITDLPKGRKAIGYNWVLKVKYKLNGEVEVAKDFSQKEGIDYKETFSLVVKIETVRCLLTIVLSNKWPIYQLHINNAFLNGDLIEDVSMQLPNGYLSDNDNKVCKLTKSSYGLKQAHSKWNEKLTQVLNANGFIQIHCLSQFMHAPCQSHLKHAFYVLRYLKGSPGTGISFKHGTNLNMSTYVDCDWAKFKITRKSMTGYVVYMGMDLVSWKSKKLLAKSLAEAEYRAMNSGTCEVLWIIKILNYLKIKVELSLPLSCDSSSAIQIAANSVFH
ncbi:ribonuclease H-like domain-containing protein [Tanacetum coccineum]